MANSFITPTKVVRDGLILLDNMLVWPKLVHTDYSDEFTDGTGESVTIRRPVSYQGYESATMAVSDTDVGSTTVSIDKWAGVAIQFTDKERTLSVERFRQDYLVPAMRTIANTIDRNIAAKVAGFWNHVGTAGNTIDSWADFARAPQRMDEMAMPETGRKAVLTPNDGYSLAGSFNTVYVNNIAKSAIEEAELPKMAGVDNVYRSNNVTSITTGTRTNGAGLLTNGTTQTSSWTTVKSTYAQDLVCDGFGAGATVKAGEVFTLGTMAAGMVAVNPVPSVTGSKPAQTYLQQFVVNSDATADGSGNITLNISPPLITSGPYQTVSMTSANTDGLNLVFIGNASTTIPLNAAFHRNAIAFVNRPLVMPAGVTECARETYKGISMRFAPVWDGTNSVQRWRLDVIYGVKTIDGRLGVRISG